MDWHLIGLGVQTVIFLAGVYAMVLRSAWTGKGLKDEMAGLKKQMEKLAEVITMQAVQTTKIENINTQLVMLQRNVEDLRRGDNWITGHRKGVDGEYP